MPLEDIPGCDHEPRSEYIAQQVEEAISELRKTVKGKKGLQDLTAADFAKMLHDIGKWHRLEGIEKVIQEFVHLPEGKKLYAFGGYKGGQKVASWELTSLFENVKVCDWLDYYGYERPKWRPKNEPA